MPKKRTIAMTTVNELKAAHGRISMCIDDPDGAAVTEHLDEAEYLLRTALAGLGFQLPRRPSTVPQIETTR